jgi:putative heme iron utilization protein
MTTWPDFVAAEPDLAQRVQALFEVRKHATLATVRADGAPRISGTEVVFADGDLYVGSMGGARKALDLRRDPRYALHCPTVDPPADDQSAWAGDAKLAGHAHEDGAEPGHENSHRFRLDVAEVVLTKVGDPPDHLLIESWHPDRGRTLHKRY